MNIYDLTQLFEYPILSAYSRGYETKTVYGLFAQTRKMLYSMNIYDLINYGHQRFQIFKNLVIDWSSNSNHLVSSCTYLNQRTWLLDDENLTTKWSCGFKIGLREERKNKLRRKQYAQTLPRLEQHVLSYLISFQFSIFGSVNPNLAHSRTQFGSFERPIELYR